MYACIEDFEQLQTWLSQLDSRSKAIFQLYFPTVQLRASEFCTEMNRMWHGGACT